MSQLMNPSVMGLDKVIGWDELPAIQKTAVREETQHAMDALYQEGSSRLAVGEHLFNLRKILEPKKLWFAFLKHVFGMSRATAYRYIARYTATKKKMPQRVLTVALQHGYDLKPDAIMRTRIPKTDDPDKIIEYLDSVAATPRRKTTHLHYDPALTLKESVNFIRLQWNKLPNNKVTRAGFSESLVGMELTLFGFTKEATFQPVPIPESYLAVRGRPPHKKAA